MLEESHLYHEDLSVKATPGGLIEPSSAAMSADRSIVRTSSLQSVRADEREPNASPVHASVLELKAARVARVPANAYYGLPSPFLGSQEETESGAAVHVSADAYSGSPIASAGSQQEANFRHEALGARPASSSLEQLQRACSVAPSNVLLPGSSNTSLAESESVSSFLQLQPLSPVVASCVPLPESSDNLSGRDTPAKNTTASPSIMPGHVATTQAPSSSLEQIQRVDPDCPVLPSRVALPESADGLSGRGISAKSSSAGTSSFVATTHTTLSSLEQLQQLDPGHPVLPPNVPLPKSTETLPGEGMFVPPPMDESYWQRVLPLQEILPHLKLNLLTIGRHWHAGKVACIDKLANGTVLNLGQFNMKRGSDRSGLATTLALLQLGWDQIIASRVILVEHLCPVVIEMLARIGLDPDFFAEHLNQSGYQSADWKDPPPARWNTAYTEKVYSSMAWCRPVYQNTKLTEWLQTPDDLLSKLKGSKDNASKVMWRDADFTDQGTRNTDIKEHRLVLETNIFRQNWGLSARPLCSDLLRRQVLDPQAADWDEPQFKTITSVPTAWQERLSVCVCSSPNGTPIGKSFDCPAWH